MPGKGTAPGAALYPECAQEGLGGTYLHRKHGTPTCEHCRGEMAKHAAGYRKRRYLARRPLKVPSRGTQRRLRALALVGWPHEEIGRRMGMSRTAVSKILSQDVVYLETAERFAEFYREHAWISGPSEAVRRLAYRKGWPGPLDWDDIDGQADVVASYVIERDHQEALKANREMKKMQAKRDKRARLTPAERVNARAARESAA